MMIRRDFPKFLKVAVVLGEVTPYSHLFDRYETKRMSDAPLLSLLSEILDFEFEVVQPRDELYGTASANGSWSGLIGMLQREEADIAIGQLSMTEKRMEVVDFSYPYKSDAITFISEKLRYSDDNYAIFYPFSPCVWLAAITSLIIVLLLSSYIFQLKNETSQSVKIFGSLLEKSVNFKLRHRSTKLLMYSWVIGAMFLTYAYKAVLLSCLTIPLLTGVRDITQLSKAAEDTSFICSTYEDTKLYYEMLLSGDDTWRRIGDCLVRSQIFTDDVGTFMQIPSNKKAFIGEKSLLTPFRKDYFVSDDIFANELLSIGVRKSFCCKVVLDEVIYKLATTGILQKFERDYEFFYSPAKNYLVREKKYNAIQKLTLADFSGAFFMLLSGYLIAGAVLFVEMNFERKD